MVRFGRRVSWRFPNYVSRLPEHYYKYKEQLDLPSARVHDRKTETQFLDYKKHEKHDFVVRLTDRAIEVLYPKEADLGIWGGEGIVKGYIKTHKFYERAFPKPRYWFPNLKKSVFYSEILDKYLEIVCTKRTLSLVDSFYGFDSYILRTPVQDLKSKLALQLRRQMLVTLVKKEFNDPKRGDELVEKYKDCIIPLEEAEWVGLTMTQAMTKQKYIEAKLNKPIPLKVTLAEELISELKRMKENGELDIIIKEEDNKSWFTKIKTKLRFKS